MQRPSSEIHIFCLCLFGGISFVTALRTQTPSSAPQAAATPPVQLNYADNPGGLEKLVKDIMKAQKENNPSRAGELLQTMMLPDPRAWYNQVFGERSAAKEGVRYESIASRLPFELATTFVNAQQDQMTEVTVVRFERSCDDDAGEETFGILQARLDPIPLYEVRLFDGGKFRRLFPFAFVDGAFRFILSPKMEDFVSGRDAPDLRIRVGGNVTAARVITKVAPHYPEVARNEHLQGTVRLHAIIGKDGNIKSLNVIRGACSLAEASLDAVRKWRYQPTLLNGQPIEVDTTVDVIFQLNY